MLKAHAHAALFFGTIIYTHRVYGIISHPCATWILASLVPRPSDTSVCRYPLVGRANGNETLIREHVREEALLWDKSEKHAPVMSLSKVLSL